MAPVPFTLLYLCLEIVFLIEQVLQGMPGLVHDQLLGGDILLRRLLGVLLVAQRLRHTA